MVYAVYYYSSHGSANTLSIPVIRPYCRLAPATGYQPVSMASASPWANRGCVLTQFAHLNSIRTIRTIEGLFHKPSTNIFLWGLLEKQLLWSVSSGTIYPSTKAIPCQLMVPLFSFLNPDSASHLPNFFGETSFRLE